MCVDAKCLGLIKKNKRGESDKVSVGPRNQKDIISSKELDQRCDFY